MTPDLAANDERLPPSPARAAARVILLYIAGVFVAAALGAPWLYQAVQHIAAHARVFAPLTTHPLHRYLQRLLLVFAVVALPTLLRALGLRRWRDVGLDRPWAHRRALGAGTLVGAATMLAAAAVPIAAGTRVLDPTATPGRVAVRVLTALAVAPLVALLEEFIFRGVIDGGLRRAQASRTALAASAAFYAGVHFLARPHHPPAVTWMSGLATLGAMLGGLASVDALVPAFFTLWLVGAYLGALAQRAGTLFASVGVHAGAIFVLQLYGLVTTDVAGADTRVWGTGRLVDGWAALGVVVAAGAIGRVVSARRASTAEQLDSDALRAAA